EVIEDELSAMEPGVFMRERLGMWSFAGERSVVPIEDWQMCEDRETRVLPQDIERVVLSADITPSRDAGALVAAIQTTDGKPPIVDVIDQRAGSVAWIPAKIADVVEKFGADAVIIDGYSPASSLIEDIQARGVGVTKVKVDFVCTAAERFLDSVLTHTVRQLGQGSVQVEVSGARTGRVGGGRSAFGADAVIIDGYAPASSLIEDIQARWVGVTKVKVDFVCTAAERFLDSVLTHTVRQLGQGSMQLALSGARKRRVGEGRFAFGRLNS